MSDTRRAAAEVAAALGTVIAERGVPSSGPQLRALLNDLVPAGSRDHRAHIDLLVAATDDGLIRELAEGSGSDRQELAARLAAAHSLTDETASWVVDSCAAALRVDLTGRTKPDSVVVDPVGRRDPAAAEAAGFTTATTPLEQTRTAPSTRGRDPQSPAPDPQRPDRRSTTAIGVLVVFAAVALVGGGLLLGTRIGGNQNLASDSSGTTARTAEDPTSSSSTTTSTSATTTSTSTTTTKPATTSSALVSDASELPAGWSALLGSSQPTVAREVSDITELLGEVRHTGADAAVYRSDDLLGRTNLRAGYLVLLVGGFRDQASASAFCSSLDSNLKPYGCNVNPVG